MKGEKRWEGGRREHTASVTPREVSVDGLVNPRVENERTEDGCGREVT